MTLTSPPAYVGYQSLEQAQLIAPRAASMYGVQFDVIPNPESEMFPWRIVPGVANRD